MLVPAISPRAVARKRRAQGCPPYDFGSGVVLPTRAQAHAAAPASFRRAHPHCRSARAKPRRRHCATRTAIHHQADPEQKVYVVKRLATYDTPTAIVRDLKALFGVEITIQAADHYHPEHVSSEKRLAPCWKELFWATRKAFIAACAEVGTMEQMVRVRLREDMVLMARDAGHYRIANELLDNIAKEAGPDVRQPVHGTRSSWRPLPHPWD
jgi:hypothetical protein